MLLGFGVSGVFERPVAQRNAALLKTGMALTGGFILLRAIDMPPRDRRSL